MAIITDLKTSSNEVVNPNIVSDNIPSEAVNSAKLAPSSVTADKLANGAVSQAKLADSSVSANKIQASAVTQAKIATGAVTNGKLGSASVTTDKLANQAVTGVKIEDNAITFDKLAPYNTKRLKDLLPRNASKSDVIDMFSHIVDEPTSKFTIYQATGNPENNLRAGALIPTYSNGEVKLYWINPDGGTFVAYALWSDADGDVWQDFYDDPITDGIFVTSLREY